MDHRQVAITLDSDSGPVEIERLGFGAPVGEMSLLDRGPTSARVSALGPVKTYCWPHEDLRQHFLTHESTELKLLRVLSRAISVRLRESNRRHAAPSD